MRDPRFRDTERWHQQIAQLRAEADAAMDALGPTDVVVAGTAIVLDASDAAWCEVLKLAVPAFPASLCSDLERYLNDEISLQNSSWAAIARALATLAVRGEPSAKRIVTTSARLERAPQWTHSAFDEYCLAVLRSRSKEEQEAWLVEFERPLSLVEPTHAQSGSIEVRRYRPWELKDVFDLWGGKVPWAIEAAAEYVPLYLFRSLAPERWFRCVDAWPDARLIGGALFGDFVQHDRIALLGWLAAAGPVFDANGDWTGRSAAIILTREVLRHAAMLLGAVDRSAFEAGDKVAVETEVNKLRETELPAFFAEAWEVLLGRSDGTRIGAALLSDLSDPAHDRRGHQAVVRELAQDALACALASRATPTGEIRRFWMERRLVRQAHRLGPYAAQASGVAALAAATRIAECKGLQDEELLAFLLDRVAEPDEDWARLVRGNALNAFLARVLHLVPPTAAVLAQCEALYEALEPARRRGEYGRTYLLQDADVSSLLVLFILLGFSDEERIDAQRGAEATSRAVQWATRLVLTGTSTSPTIDARRILAYAARQSARLVPDIIPDIVRVAVPDPPLAALVAASLLAVLDRETVDGHFRREGLPLEELAARARDWAEITGNADDHVVAEDLLAKASR